MASSPQDRHPGESRDPSCRHPAARRWIPAFAGMTLVAIALMALSTAANAIDIQKCVSPRGIPAWLVEDHSNPLISTVVGFRGGSSADEKGREGAAFMVSALLDEGAGDLDSAAFQQRLADLAVDFSCSTD